MEQLAKQEEGRANLITEMLFHVLQCFFIVLRDAFICRVVQLESFSGLRFSLRLQLVLETCTLIELDPCIRIACGNGAPITLVYVRVVCSLHTSCELCLSALATVAHACASRCNSFRVGVILATY